MGAFCCCPCGEDVEEYNLPNNPIYRHCVCLRYFFHQLFSGYSAMFERLEVRTGTTPVQGATPLTSTGVGSAAAESPMSETFHLVPRPAPYDTDPRYSRLQRDGLISRREKYTSHIQDDAQVVRRNDGGSGADHVGSGKKRSSAGSEEDYKDSQNESDKSLAAKVFGMGYTLTDSEDEDVCPTCLDEYTPENPKILTKCAHHFHLGCIYEWMERSENCPICGKEMDFCESP